MELSRKRLKKQKPAIDRQAPVKRENLQEFNVTVVYRKRKSFFEIFSMLIKRPL